MIKYNPRNNFNLTCHIHRKKNYAKINLKLQKTLDRSGKTNVWRDYHSRAQDIL